MSSGLVDTRLDLRTPCFGGDDAGWESWCLKFEAYCHLVGLGPSMDAAAERTDPIRTESMGDETLAMTKNLYALLISKCEGRALSIVSLAPLKTGFES